MLNNTISRIAIVTDSTSDLPKELIKKYNITVVPLTVNFEDGSFVDDGISLTIDEFYQKLKASARLPKTSQPSPGTFQNIYADLLKTNDTIISIHISAKLSATLNSANLAAEEFPGRDIQVIDSCAAHAPLGMIVLKAAALNDGKNTKEEILEAVDDIKKKVKAFIIPKNLENLSKGGRIGKARVFLATVLDIKPILTLDPFGEIVMFKTTRGWEHAKSEAIKAMQSMVDADKKVEVIISDANASDDVDDVESQVKEKFENVKITKIKIGITVGTHVGTGIGLTFYQE